MRVLKALFGGFIALVLTACVSLTIPPPSEQVSTLLALPFVLDSRSQQGGPMGFHYIYDIASTDGGGIRQSVKFKERQDKDIMLVDSLPPGEFRVVSISLVPAGSGEHTYGNNKQAVDFRFRMEAGKITVFPKLLTVERYNATVGRGMSTNYRDTVSDLSSDKLDEIVKILSELPNYEMWTVAETW